MSVITAKKQPDQRAALTQAVVKVGSSGRGFVVESEDRGRPRIVITAAHCLVKRVRERWRATLSPAHLGSYAEERTYESLLGPLGNIAEPAGAIASAPAPQSTPA